MPRVDRESNSRSLAGCTITQNANLLYFSDGDTGPNLGYRLHRRLGAYRHGGAGGGTQERIDCKYSASSERAMPNMRTLDNNELREILIKNWMTHDAMWFHHCLQECRIERTNKINKAAVRAMGMIEIKRIQKALGIGKVETFEDFRLLSDATWSIVNGEFMRFSYSYPAKTFSVVILRTALLMKE